MTTNPSAPPCAVANCPGPGGYSVEAGPFLVRLCPHCARRVKSGEVRLLPVRDGARPFKRFVMAPVEGSNQ